MKFKDENDHESLPGDKFVKRFMFVSSDIVLTVVTNFKCLKLVFRLVSIVIGQILTLQCCVQINWLYFK